MRLRPFSDRYEFVALLVWKVKDELASTYQHIHFERCYVNYENPVKYQSNQQKMLISVIRKTERVSKSKSIKHYDYDALMFE